MKTLITKNAALGLLVLCASFVSPAQAELPPWCSDKTLTTAEQTICDDPTLSKADSLMVQVYKTLLTQPLKTGEDGLGPSEIIADQRQWVEERNKLVEKSEILDAYTARIQALTNVLIRTW